MYRPDSPAGHACPTGLTTWGDLFTSRQLVALTTFSDLVAEAMERVKQDAASIPENGLPLGLTDDGIGLDEGGCGATAISGGGGGVLWRLLLISRYRHVVVPMLGMDE